MITAKSNRLLSANLRTGLLVEGLVHGPDWISLDVCAATIPQLREMRVRIYDRSSKLGKELSFRRAQNGIKDGLKKVEQRPRPGSCEIKCPHCGALMLSTAKITRACSSCGNVFFVPGGREIRLKQMRELREL